MSSTITSWCVSLGEYPCFSNSFFRNSFTCSGGKTTMPVCICRNQLRTQRFTQDEKQVHNMHVFQTSSLDSFQSSSRSISLKESCDLGPFLISMSSMSKMSVLPGGILPERQTDQKVKPKYKTQCTTPSMGYLFLLCHRPELEGWSASCVPLCTYPEDLYPNQAAPHASQEWAKLDFCPHLSGWKESTRGFNTTPRNWHEPGRHHTPLQLLWKLLPGMKHGAVALQESLVVNKKHVPQFGFSGTHEGFVNNFDFYLWLRQFPPGHTYKQRGQYRANC